MTTYILARINSQARRYPTKEEVVFEGTKEECIEYCKANIYSGVEQTQLAYDFPIFSFVMINDTTPVTLFLINKEYESLVGSSGNPAKDVIRNLERYAHYQHGYTLSLLFSTSADVDFNDPQTMNGLGNIIMASTVAVLKTEALNGAYKIPFGSFLGNSIWAVGNLKEALIILRRQVQRFVPPTVWDDVFLPTAKSLMMFDANKMTTEDASTYSTVLGVPGGGLCYICLLKVPAKASGEIAQENKAWDNALKVAFADSDLWPVFGFDEAQNGQLTN